MLRLFWMCKPVVHFVVTFYFLWFKNLLELLFSWEVSWLGSKYPSYICFKTLKLPILLCFPLHFVWRPILVKCRLCRIGGAVGCSTTHLPCLSSSRKLSALDVIWWQWEPSFFMSGAVDLLHFPVALWWAADCSARTLGASILLVRSLERIWQLHFGGGPNGLIVVFSSAKVTE